MPQFHFKARDINGKELIGKRQALTIEDLAGQLQRENLIPIEISPVSIKSSPQRAKKAKSQRQFHLFTKKVSLDELLIFCRQVYTLLKAGIPIITIVKRLSETGRDKQLTHALEDVLVSLNKGRNLSLSLSQFPDIFSDFFISLVKVGETTGKLDAIFLYLAEYIEMEIDTGKKIKTALRYPKFVVSALVVAMIIVNVFVIPAFTQFFAQFHATLPLPTRILLAVSHFVIHYLYFLIFIIGGSAFLTYRFIHSPKGKIKWARFKNRIPILGWLLQRITLARFSKLYSLVLRAGMSAVDGITMIGSTAEDPIFSEKIKKATELIRRGNLISYSLAQTKMFPPLVMQMITLGEESGKVDSILDDITDYYQREITYDLKRMSDYIEPILIVILAFFVLILALGVFLPMWSIAGQIH